MNQMENVIENLLNRNESVIVEGVHINMKFIANLTQKYKYVIPFFIYIKDSERHKERFAVRSKNMTLKSTANKYISNINNIRTIQAYILSIAEVHRIPALDNTNIDKSLGLLQQTILGGLNKVWKGDKLISEESLTISNMHPLNTIFKNIQNKILSSKQANNIIMNKLIKEDKIDLDQKLLGFNITNDKQIKVDYLSDGEDSKRKGSYQTTENSLTRRNQLEKRADFTQANNKKFYSLKKNFRKSSNSNSREGSITFKSDIDMNIIGEVDNNDKTSSEDSYIEKDKVKSN